MDLEVQKGPAKLSARISVVAAGIVDWAHYPNRERTGQYMKPHRRFEIFCAGN